MKEFTFEERLMGSDLAVAIVASDENAARENYQRALSLGREYEERFSRFLPHSELSRLNTKKNLVVSDEFMQVFDIARRLYQETQGIFNPLVQIERLGYNKDFAQLVGVLPARTDPYDTDFAHIRVHSEERRIILADTQKLDFGGFLKGHVAQLMVESMREVSGAIVNLGGDIYTTGRDANGIPFVFGVYNPLLGDDVVVLPVSDGAIATSGTYRRVWDTRLGQRHHILDAHGMKNPTTDIMSATVVLPDGYRADAYATVAVVLGSRRARQFLSERGAHYVCITDEGGVESSGADISYIHENVSLVH